MRLRRIALLLAEWRLPQPKSNVAAQIDRALARRRVGRGERQATAVRREVAKHHDRFVRDPIIRSLRPDLIIEGDHHVR